MSKSVCYTDEWHSIGRRLSRARPVLEVLYANSGEPMTKSSLQLLNKTAFLFSIIGIFDCCSVAWAQNETDPGVTATRQVLDVPGDYSTIQSAIDAASPNDVVAIRGTFVESLIIDKPLVLTGRGVVRISPAAEQDRVICVRSSGVSLRQLRISGGLFGIEVEPGSRDLTINGVRVDNASVGVFVDSNCHDAVVINSGFTNCDFSGFMITNCDSLRFVGNVLISCSLGAAFASCEDAFIVRNQFFRSGFDGMTIDGANNFVFRNDAALNTGQGFLVLGDRQMVVDNESRRNGGDGFEFRDVTEPKIDDNFSRLNGGNGFSFGPTFGLFEIGDNQALGNAGVDFFFP